MFEYIRHVLSGPVFIHESRERLRKMINTILLFSIGVTFLYGLVVYFIAPAFSLSHRVVGLILLYLALTWFINRRGHLTTASLSLTIGLWLLFTTIFFFTGGIDNPGISGYLLVVVVAGLLLGGRASIVAAVVSFLAMTILYWLEATHKLPVQIVPISSVLGSYLAITTFLVVVAVLLYLTTQNIALAFQRAYENAAALQTANLKLQQEIEERNQVAAALLESEERFRAFVETSFSGIVISSEGVIVDVNESFARMFGYSREEMIGLTPIETQTPESAQRVLAHITAKKEGPIEAVGLRKDGTTFPLEIVAKNTVYNGKPARLGAVNDLTTRKQDEEVLRQKQKMESLGLLAGGIAHDFNNLLVAVLGQASVALAKMGIEDEARPHIEKVKKAAERAASLTHQLLAYSGGGQFNIQPIQLNHLIQENIHFFEVALPPHVRLELQLDEALPLIEADAGQMQQILMNLVINGAEAINNKEGVVRLSTKTLWVDGSEAQYWQRTGLPLVPGLYVGLQVKDNGMGMSAELLDRIFDPFFSTKATGRGLGLAAVLGIIRGHQGGVAVESHPGQGTCYHLIFPALKVHEFLPELMPTPPPAITQPTRTVLVIDDEDWVREAVQDILTTEGFYVYAAANGQSGLDLFRQNQTRIHLVFLDLSMPGLTGVETYQALRSCDPHIKIILTSGYDERDVAAAFVDDPHTRFLQKPYDLTKLIQHLHSLQ